MAEVEVTNYKNIVLCQGSIRQRGREFFPEGLFFKDRVYSPEGGVEWCDEFD